MRYGSLFTGYEEYLDQELAAVRALLIAKHHDYGVANLLQFGEFGILVRSSDKVARIKNLLEKEAAVKDESRIDNWRDLAGYAIQALIMGRGGLEQPFIEKSSGEHIEHSQ